MAKIINHLIKNEPKDEHKPNIYQNVLSKLRRDKLPSPERVDCQIPDQPDDAARRSDRSAVGHEYQAQNPAAECRKQKNYRQMRPIREHLKYPANVVKSVAIHPYVYQAAVRRSPGQYPPVFVIEPKCRFHKSGKLSRLIQSDRDLSDKNGRRARRGDADPRGATPCHGAPCAAGGN